MSSKSPAISACPHCSSFHVVRKGYSKPLKSLGGLSRQYLKCRSCKRVFSENFHRHHYRLKHADPALSSKILELVMTGTSSRHIARHLGVSEHLVRIRLRRLAQSALCFQHRMIEASPKPILEPLAYDGLENFACSQYDPNNINQLIGAHSLFIYDFNFAPLNRKGRTSPWQKRRLTQIEALEGRYNPRAIRVATADILSRNTARCCPREGMLLRSDEHFQYRRAIAFDLGAKRSKIRHQTLSSRACRNYQNILFSVNHADLVIRQRLGAFSRETIAFSKTAGSMCQRFALFMAAKNFMWPQFTKRHVRRPEAHLQTPAQSAGLCARRLGFSDIFSRRYTRPEKSMNEDWKCFFEGRVPDKYLRHKRFIKCRNRSA